MELHEQDEPEPATPPRQRRGPYKRITMSAKKRIRDAYDDCRDWKTVARANGIKARTAQGYTQVDELIERQRGGYRRRILTNKQVDIIHSWVEHDNQETLEELKARVQQQFGV